MTIPSLEQYASPNHSSRGKHRIGLIVVHSTVGSFASSLSWLTSPSSRVSCHYLISREGRIAQLVQDDRTSWHAGDAIWHGTAAVNEISLGIELENMTGVKPTPARPKPYPEWPHPQPYPPAQIDAAVRLTQYLMRRYSLTRNEVVRHADVAIPRGRKHDPLAFPWDAFLARLQPKPLIVPSLPSHRTRRMTWARTIPARRGPYVILPQHTPLTILGEAEGDVVNGSPRWLHTDRGYVPAGEVEAL